MQSNHSSTRWPLWMAVAAAWPLQGLAAAGMVQFATGDVQLRRAAGALPAVKGSEVESGDIVVTGANGRAQIRFSDGGLVAREDTLHRIRHLADGDARPRRVDAEFEQVGLAGRAFFKCFDRRFCFLV